MKIDLFAQDNMRLQELVDTALAAPGAPRSGSVRPPCLAVILGRIYAGDLSHPGSQNHAAASLLLSLSGELV